MRRRDRTDRLRLFLLLALRWVVHCAATRVSCTEADALSLRSCAKGVSPSLVIPQKMFRMQKFIDHIAFCSPRMMDASMRTFSLYIVQTDVGERSMPAGIERERPRERCYAATRPGVFTAAMRAVGAHPGHGLPEPLEQRMRAWATPPGQGSRLPHPGKQ